MKIGVLGWGSLIKHPTKRGVTLDLATRWQVSNLRLPIELSRVSGLRAQPRKPFLSLVIDDRKAVRRVPVYFAVHSSPDLEVAVRNLAGREGLIEQIEDIGRTDRPARVTRIGRQIQKWASANGLDAVIWTDLPPTFTAEVRRFTIRSAAKFLRDLPLEQQRVAREYINDAPLETETRLRTHLRATGWLEAR